ncbi:hypothetical protein K3495_g11533 [Podosphaera aphanis]|nr:hypothetical protein K3495_g11533 [Podosphaera aphanis]
MDIEPKNDMSLEYLYQKLHDLQLMEEQLWNCIIYSHSYFRDVEISADNEDGRTLQHKTAKQFLLFNKERGKFIKNATQNIEKLREMLQQEINSCSRPYVRQLHLLDLPDEILIHICEYVQGRPEYFIRYIPEFNFGAQEVKNMRLTCRRLCTTSSHLLLSSIHVDMDAASLAHLEEISRHPLISRGVQVIRLNLLYYDSILGEDFEAFSDYHGHRLLETTECIEEMASHDADFFLGTPKDVVDTAIDEGWKIGRAWVDFAENDFSEEDLCYRKPLLTAYQKYRELYLEQENLLQSGTFHRAATDAMARMHKATRLDVFNTEFIGRPKRRRRPDFITMVSNEDSLVESTLFPITWEKGRRFDLGEPPQNLIFNLLNAILENGIYLSALDIKVPPSDFSALASDKKNLEVIKTTTERLKFFSYDPRVPYCSGLWAADDSSDVDALEIFISAHLHSRLLDEIQLSCDFLRVGPFSPWFSIGRVLTRRSWPKLERITLTGLAFNLSEIKQFVKQLHRPIIIFFMRIHLLSGTWAEVLDTLRGNVEYNPTLEDLSGAELNDMSEQEVKDILGKDGKSQIRDMNKAERYVLNIFNASNPFRIDDVTAST